MVVSYIGYVSQEIKAINASTLRIELEAETQALDEVVVVGYGTARKRPYGPIVNVSAKDLAGKPNSNPVASLQGRVTGLSVVNTGKPSEEPDIRIRGTVSKKPNETPLYRRWYF